jgi:hypothetical protein
MDFGMFYLNQQINSCGKINFKNEFNIFFRVFSITVQTNHKYN